MKKIIMGFFSLLLVIVLILIAYTLHGRSVRQTELQQAMEQSMEKAMSMLTGKEELRPKNEEELIVLFMENLLFMIDSSSDVEVKILQADCKKGILSATAIMRYGHPIGTTGKVSMTKTAIVEQYQKEQTEMVTLTFLSQGEVYKAYKVTKGTAYIDPGDPVLDGKTFKGWMTMEGEPVALLGKSAVRDAVYIAIFE